jgi:hypothetical protein
MSRLFTLLCLALFTLAAPACDDPDPKEPLPADEESSSSVASGPDDLAPSGSGDDTGDDSETGEDPGTATLATPHISTGATF